MSQAGHKITEASQCWRLYLIICWETETECVSGSAIIYFRGKKYPVYMLMNIENK